MHTRPIVRSGEFRKITQRDIERSSELMDALIRLYKDPVAFGHALGHRGVLEPLPDGRGVQRRKRYSQLHRDMAAHVLSSNRSSTVVARNHGKTTLLQDIALWEKWRDLSKRTMYTSATTQLASEILGEQRAFLTPGNYFELIPTTGHDEPAVLVPIEEALAELMPVKAPSNSPPGSYNCAARSGAGREPCFFPASLNTAKAGKHPTDIYVDDPSNEHTSSTPVQREKVINAFRQLEPILRDRSGNIRHIGTPWAFWDIAAYLGDHKKWSQYRFGCWDGVNPDTGVADGGGLGPDGAYALCPEYMTDMELIEEEQKVDNPEFWSQQYLVKPVAAAYAMFTDDRLRQATAQVRPEDLPPGQKILLWDPTSRADAKVGDWNGLILIHVTTAERCIGAGFAVPGLADMPKDTNLFFPVWATEIRGHLGECMETLTRLVHEHADLKSVWVEDNGSAGALKAWFHQQHWSREKGITFFPVRLTTRSSQGQRLQGIQLALQQHRILIPAEFDGREILLKRLSEYPKSESDDLPCALALLTNYAMRRSDLPGLDNKPAKLYDPTLDPNSLAFRPPKLPSSW